MAVSEQEVVHPDPAAAEKSATPDLSPVSTADESPKEGDSPQEQDAGVFLDNLVAGHPVAFPTDTVWGIGCLLTPETAPEKIARTLELKGPGRPAVASIVAPTVDAIWRFCDCAGAKLVAKKNSGAEEQKKTEKLKETTVAALAGKLLPGFYTLVLPLTATKEDFPALHAVAGEGATGWPTLGVRVTTFDELQICVKKAGDALLLATSLNMHGEPPATSPTEALECCEKMRAAAKAVAEEDDKDGGAGEPSAKRRKVVDVELRCWVPRKEVLPVFVAGQSSTVLKYEPEIQKLRVLRLGSGPVEDFAEYLVDLSA